MHRKARVNCPNSTWHGYEVEIVGPGKYGIHVKTPDDHVRCYYPHELEILEPLCVRAIRAIAPGAVALAIFLLATLEIMVILQNLGTIPGR